MKIKFMYVPLIISIICISSIHTCEEYASPEINRLVMIQHNTSYTEKQAMASIKCIETVKTQLTPEEQFDAKQHTITGNEENDNITDAAALLSKIIFKKKPNDTPPNQQGDHLEQTMKKLKISLLSPNENSRGPDRTKIATDDICNTCLGPAGKRVAIHYKNLDGKIVNLKDNTILFEGNNILGMLPSPTQKSILFIYPDYKTEMRNLEDGKTFCEDDNIYQIFLDRDATIVIFLYKNAELAVKSLGNGETLFKTKNVATGKIYQAKILLEYRGYKQELIPLSYFK